MRKLLKILVGWYILVTVTPMLIRGVNVIVKSLAMCVGSIFTFAVLGPIKKLK